MCSLFGEICIVQKDGTANVWAFKLEWGVAWRQSQGYDTLTCRSAYDTIETKYKLGSKTEITKNLPHYLV